MQKPSLALHDAARLRESLARSRVMLIFTPELCEARDALEVLRSALPWVDLVQVRPKELPRGTGGAGRVSAPASARESWDWTARVLDIIGAESAIPVLVNDRVDVAKGLFSRGCAGVHVGQDDAPPRVARDVLGPTPLLGMSTHGVDQVDAALTEPVDYLGFGPIHATSTKGYGEGLGWDAYQAARAATSLPVFAIGGVGTQTSERMPAGSRIAVGSAVLAARDPARAARDLRERLERGG